MISDGPVIQAELDHMPRNFLERATAVAPGGMIVKRTAEFGPIDEPREIAGSSGGEFALVFAEFGRNVSETKLFKNFFFGAARNEEGRVARFLGGTKQAV